MVFERINSENRERVNRFIVERWFSSVMIIRGEAVDMTAVDGIVCLDGEEIVGLVTYRIDGGVCEITSLDSLRERQGIGTMLLARLREAALERGCAKIVLITTNDNVNALRFYQKRGFDMARLYRNALAVSRKLKPEIPMTGEDGIPLRHEIEFEMELREGVKIEIDPDGTWYHGSSLRFDVLREGSTVTQWRELAEAFSHKPSMLGIEDDGSIRHNGVEKGLLYVIDEPVEAGADVYPHPRTTMEENAEWLTRRPLRVRLIEDLGM